jgi:hypothetical protein
MSDAVVDQREKVDIRKIAEEGFLAGRRRAPGGNLKSRRSSQLATAIGCMRAIVLFRPAEKLRANRFFSLE